MAGTSLAGGRKSEGKFGGSIVEGACCLNFSRNSFTDSRCASVDIVALCDPTANARVTCGEDPARAPSRRAA